MNAMKRVQSLVNITFCKNIAYLLILIASSVHLNKLASRISICNNFKRISIWPISSTCEAKFSDQRSDNNSNGTLTYSTLDRSLTPPQTYVREENSGHARGGHSGRTIKSEKRGRVLFLGGHGVLSVPGASRKLRENSVYGQRAVRTKLRGCLADAYPWCVREALRSGLDCHPFRRNGGRGVTRDGPRFR